MRIVNKQKPDDQRMVFRCNLYRHLTGFPESNGFDAIIVSVDRFSKMVHLIPCMKSLNAKGICDLVIQNVACYHDLPDTAVSYRRTSILS